MKHVAQMNKYNLYDDLQSKPITYGKSINQAVDFVLNCDNTIDWFVGK